MGFGQTPNEGESGSFSLCNPYQRHTYQPKGLGNVSGIALLAEIILTPGRELLHISEHSHSLGL